MNTNYELETKCLSMWMGKMLPKEIHQDQAGFVPGRDILDHVKLAQVVAEYCKMTRQDGVLIALDQEKAYDRMDHNYRWEVIRGYGLPDPFINRVKSWYKRAKTAVLLNKVQGRAFPVQGGVRQGDPMSCLLFNLAIEPLAEALHRSDLEGIRIPGTAIQIICKLFADDTQLFLSKNNKLSKAIDIANRWCLASTAKFHERKPEVLLISTETHSRKVERTRSLQRNRPEAEPLPEGVRIVSTSEPLRIFGGMVGYNLDLNAIWDPIVTKMVEQKADYEGQEINPKLHHTVKGPVPDDDQQPRT